jgi:hypothetical protein
VNEDGQLGLDRDKNNLLAPTVVESLLGVEFKGRSRLSSPLVGGSRNTLAIDAEGEVRMFAFWLSNTYAQGQCHLC